MVDYRRQLLGQPPHESHLHETTSRDLRRKTAQRPAAVEVASFLFCSIPCSDGAPDCRVQSSREPLRESCQGRGHNANRRGGCTCDDNMEHYDWPELTPAVEAGSNRLATRSDLCLGR